MTPCRHLSTKLHGVTFIFTAVATLTVPGLAAGGHSTLLRGEMTALFLQRVYLLIETFYVDIYSLYGPSDWHPSLDLTSDDTTSSLSNRNLLFPFVIFTLCKWSMFCHVVTWQFVSGWSWFNSITVRGAVALFTNINTLNHLNPLHTQNMTISGPTFWRVGCKICKVQSISCVKRSTKGWGRGWWGCRTKKNRNLNTVCPILTLLRRSVNYSI